jgi:polyisoprenoid-binding protein YceI
VDYSYGRQEKWQNVGQNPTVTFQTINVVIKLVDHTGLKGLTGGVVRYSQPNSNAWHDIGTTGDTGQVSIELLPLNFGFSMDYAYGRQEKWQKVSQNPTVTFQTSQVHSNTNKCLQYNKGGWHTFTQDMELLPGYYGFLFSDGTKETWYTIAAGVTKFIH